MGFLVSSLMIPTPIGTLPASRKWQYLTARFDAFLKNMDFTDVQVQTFRTNIDGVVECLNRKYWPFRMPAHVYHKIGGSWGTNTQVRTISDIDLLYVLPNDMQRQFIQRVGNVQSQILQDVRNTLFATYPRSDIRGDGPTVVVKFDSIKIEVAPIFSRTGLPVQYEDLVGDACYTNDGGSFQPTAPAAELLQLQTVDNRVNGALVALIRMLKVWKQYCNVPIKSIVLQQMAIAFMRGWPADQTRLMYYDWIVRDFFRYMLTQVNGFAILPGSLQIVSFGNDWESKAKSAYNAAVSACTYEAANYNSFAGQEWQKIFGTFIKKEV